MAKEIRVSYSCLTGFKQGYVAEVRGEARSKTLGTPEDVYAFLNQHANALQLGKRNYLLIVEQSAPKESAPEFTAFEKRINKLAVKIEEKNRKP